MADIISLLGLRPEQNRRNSIRVDLYLISWDGNDKYEAHLVTCYVLHFSNSSSICSPDIESASILSPSVCGVSKLEYFFVGPANKPSVNSDSPESSRFRTMLYSSFPFRKFLSNSFTLVNLNADFHKQKPEKPFSTASR